MSHDVTRMLERMADGDADAAADLLPLVYGELREMAERCLRHEAATATLQPTALVHDLSVRLLGGNGCAPRTRAQFFTVAAKAMRHLLIDKARRRRAAKRGGDRRRVELDDVAVPSVERDAYLLALDDALTELTEFDGDLARVVELRFFGGLGVEEAARVLGVAPATVKRRWRFAKGWLHRRITETA